MPLVGWFCAVACSAALSVTGSNVNLFGHAIGQYVDDTAPHQCSVVSDDVALGWPLVIAGEAPGGGPVCPGAIMAREWYPFRSGGPASAWGPMPRARAYILQWHFSFTGRPPTRHQRRVLYREALKRHPRLILWF